MALQEPWPGLAPEDGDVVPPLDAYVDDVAHGDDPGTPASGRVWADRQLARLRRLRHEVDQADATANARIDEINAWHDRITERLYRRIDEINAELDGYMRAEADETGVKTLTLPSGELKLRGGPDKAGYRRVIVVGDEDYVAAELPDELIRVKHSVRKDVVKTFAALGPPVDTADSGIVDVSSGSVTQPPAGFVAHVAVLPDSGVVLDGVYFLVPERETFTAKPYPYTPA